MQDAKNIRSHARCAYRTSPTRDVCHDLHCRRIPARLVPGIGLAAAILIDATIVRAVLLPATMKLLGTWNWYLPRWLGWLPNLEHERSAEPVPQQAAA
jgi:hypothetical protein